MRRSKILRDERTILNIDLFDRRRFQEIFKVSERLQRVSWEGSLPTMESLLRDIWASLYKMKPEILKEDIPESMSLNYILLKRWMESDEFENNRIYTKLDEFLSAIYTARFAEKLDDWFDEKCLRDTDFQQTIDDLKLYNEEAEDNCLVEKEAIERNETNSQFTEEMNDKLEASLDADNQIITKASEEAMEEAIRTKETIHLLMGGVSAGKNPPDLKKMALCEKFAVAEKLVLDTKFKKISEWTGRIHNILQKKRQTEYAETIERRNVTLGNDLERVLASELALFSHPVIKKDFLRRFAEKELMQLDGKKRTNLGRGPIVICLDQSDSMSEYEIQAKSLVIALLSVAKKQKRDLYVILFSQDVQHFIYKKGKINARDLLHLARIYLRGGTDYSLALHAASKAMKMKRFSKADLLFITDGEGEVCKSFLEQFHGIRNERRFQIQSILFGDKLDSIHAFSDKILCVENIDEEGCLWALEI